LSKATKTRRPPYRQAALEGLVRPVAANEWRVELASRGRLQHNVVLVRQADPLELGQSLEVEVPQCTDCRHTESGYLNLFECELAVQVQRELDVRRARTRERRAQAAEGVDRVRIKSPLYDAARRHCKPQAMRYLRAVVDELEMPDEVNPDSPYWKPAAGPKPSGRPPANPWDLVFCAAVYAGLAKTTLIDFLQVARQCYRDGLLKTEPAENWPSKAMGKQWVRAKLEEALGVAVRPVAHLVKEVATDKTGEEEQGGHTYREAVWGPRVPNAEVGDEAGWEKRAKAARTYTGLHLVTSTELGLIVAAKARPGNEHESKHLVDLLEAMLRHSHARPGRLLADMGYSYPSLVQQVHDRFGIELVTPPKQNSNAQVSGAPRWNRLHRWYTMKFDEFAPIYGRRSVTEGVNSALKEAHGEALKCVHPEAKLTEAVGKALMHTVNRVLVVMFERGLGYPQAIVEAPVDEEDLASYT
jgi:transposase